MAPSPHRDEELSLLADADERARRYIAGIGARPVFPDGDALAGLERFDEALTDEGCSSA